MPEHNRRGSPRSGGEKGRGLPLPSVFDRQILNRKWVRALLWLCVIGIAAMIFFFSSQSGDASSETSDKVVRVVVRVVCPKYDTLPGIQQESVWSRVSFYVRKSAHFLEYAALGFFLRWLMASYSLRPGALWAWLAGTLYASTDELHQLLSGARSGMWQDVLLDSSGVLFGELAALAVAAIVAYAARKRNST